MDSKKPIVNCHVCTEKPSKYKCPSCTSPYCSVACFKIHKEKDCQALTDTKKTQALAPAPAPIQPADSVPQLDDDERIILTPAQLGKIGQSKELMSQLKSTKIREIIKEIQAPRLTRSERESLLMQAMQEPDFGEFLEEMLHTVGYT